MHPLDAQILEAFRRDPSRTFSTTDLVRELFPDEHARFRAAIESGEKRRVRRGFYEKAKLHRQLLYHMNKLVGRSILQVVGTRGKGEKLFQLALEEGELVIQDKAHRIVITKHARFATAVDGDEKRGIVKKYQPGTWLTKHDAILIDGLAFEEPEHLLQRLQQVFPIVSDAVAITRAEHVFDAVLQGRLQAFLERLGQDARDYEVALSLLFQTEQVGQELLDALRATLPRLPSNIVFIFNLTPRLLSKRNAFFTDLFTLFAEAKRKLTLKNSTISPLPIFFGGAGPYSFTPEDWAYYQAEVRGKADGCIVGQTTIAIDIQRFLESGSSIAELRNLAERAANAFFEAEEQRRQHFSQQPALPLSSLEAAREFHKVGRNYLRFWNGDWEDADQYPLLELLGSVKERLDEFSKMQEVIYKSCGLPIHFKIGLSTSFARFDQDFFSERRYQKTAISNLRELQTVEMKRYLAIRERLFQLFDSADRLRFFIARTTPVAETLRIARSLLSAYALPSITLDFRGKSGELKLTRFL